jgi:hypothetical protein
MRPPKVTYRLVRTTPKGEVKAHERVFPAVAAACAAAWYVLTDNTTVTRAEANAFAARLHAAPAGTELTHEPTGYMFRIDVVEAAVKAAGSPVDRS